MKAGGVQQARSPGPESHGLGGQAPLQLPSAWSPSTAAGPTGLAPACCPYRSQAHRLSSPCLLGCDQETAGRCCGLLKGPVTLVIYLEDTQRQDDGPSAGHPSPKAHSLWDWVGGSWQRRPHVGFSCRWQRPWDLSPITCCLLRGALVGRWSPEPGPCTSCPLRDLGCPP